jgi:hypothetical protein
MLQVTDTACSFSIPKYQTLPAHGSNSFRHQPTREMTETIMTISFSGSLFFSVETRLVSMQFKLATILVKYATLHK